jgi:hypothetical protein
MFDEAALSIEEVLVMTSASGLTYIAEWKYGKLEHKGQSIILVPSLILGAQTFRMFIQAPSSAQPLFV